MAIEWHARNAFGFGWFGLGIKLGLAGCALVLFLFAAREALSLASGPIGML